MIKNTSVTLGPHFLGFVEGQVASGRFASTSEVVRAGLRLLEEHEERRAALNHALAEGEASGPASSLDLDAFLAARRADPAA
jgi:antitoxin ParD1/3/4